MGNKEADLAKKMLLRLCYYEAMNGEKLEDLRMDSLLYKRLDSASKGRGNWPQDSLSL